MVLTLAVFREQKAPLYMQKAPLYMQKAPLYMCATRTCKRQGHLHVLCCSLTTTSSQAQAH